MKSHVLSADRFQDAVIDADVMTRPAAERRNTPGRFTSGSASNLMTEFINPLSGSEWDQSVASHPGAGFFHTAAWARVLARTYGHNPYYMRLSEGDRLLALVPIMEVRSVLTGCRGVCLPFTDECEPLYFPGCTFGTVVEKLRELGSERNWKHFEIRGSTADDSAIPAVAFYSHVLDLTCGASEVAAGFDSSVRRAIRKAEASGLTVEITRTREAVREFYQLHVGTRRKHGAPPQPFSFFLNIDRHVIEPGFGFVAMARRGTQPVAAAMFFEFAGKAIYKFGASDESVQQLRANNLVMARAIEHLAGQGARSLHFGRTSLSNDGLRRFKRSWGAREVRTHYFKADPVTGRWLSSRDQASGVHTALFKRLPISFNRMAGALLYSHLD